MPPEPDPSAEKSLAAIERYAARRLAAARAAHPAPLSAPEFVTSSWTADDHPQSEAVTAAVIRLFRATEHRLTLTQGSALGHPTGRLFELPPEPAEQLDRLHAAARLLIEAEHFEAAAADAAREQATYDRLRVNGIENPSYVAGALNGQPKRAVSLAEATAAAEAARQARLDAAAAAEAEAAVITNGAYVRGAIREQTRRVVSAGEWAQEREQARLDAVAARRAEMERYRQARQAAGRPPGGI